MKLKFILHGMHLHYPYARTGPNIGTYPWKLVRPDYCYTYFTEDLLIYEPRRLRKPEIISKTSRILNWCDYIPKKL